MKITIPLIALLVLCVSSDCLADAASPDSLVRWNEINFTSDFERDVLKRSLKESNKDYLELFLANSPSPAEDLKYFTDKINHTLEEINRSGELKRKNDKKIKYLYDLIHKRFLLKYEAENRFYEIIKKGNYNCVTATALYAIFFEKLNIPYAIKEEPTHVYLIAYPNAENILIETTTPLYGFLAFDANFKSNYVNTLKSQKIIGSSEAVASNVDELFNKYYFGTGNISLTQLIGIHYQNDALFMRDHSNIPGGYEQIKKASLFYSNTRSGFLLMSFSAAVLEETNTDLLKKANLIGILSRFRSSGITVEMIQGEFYKLTQTVLFKNNDKELYKKCYTESIRNIQGEEIAKEISYIYFYENGRVFYNQGNYIRAKPFFARAMEIQPNNVDLGGIFVSCLSQSFRNERDNSAVVDSLDVYKFKFPSLSENINFNSLIALAYAIEFGNSFESSNIARGEKYKKLFEEIYTTDKNLTLLNPDAVGRSYSEACAYYFKKGQKGKANQLVDKGLQIVPDNYQLRMRKRMMNGG
ncbi:MAG: hypothetical protein C0490_05415 [Marivirga sp.]|nr:hypothetical protein [Marivirga sp.]